MFAHVDNLLVETMAFVQPLYPTWEDISIRRLTVETAMPPVAEGGLIGIKYQNDFTVIKETMTRVVKYSKPNRGRVIQSDQHQHQCQYVQTFSNRPGLGLQVQTCKWCHPFTVFSVIHKKTQWMLGLIALLSSLNGFWLASNYSPPFCWSDHQGLQWEDLPAGGSNFKYKLYVLPE